MKKTPLYFNMQTALEYAIISLTRRRQTEKQIRDRLKKRYPHEDMEPIIARVKELDYLNDEHYAADFITYRSRSSPRGKFGLSRELAKKGIEQSIRDQALQHFDERESLERLAAEQWKKMQFRSAEKYGGRPSGSRQEYFSALQCQKQRLLRFLASRGFSLTDSLDVVNSLAKG